MNRDLHAGLNETLRECLRYLPYQLGDSIIENMVRASLSLALVSLGLLCGCAQTINNDEMVRLYLNQAPPGQSEYGWYADYAGLQSGYHHLKVMYSNFNAGPFAVLFKGAFTTKEYRCKADTLPAGFPDDLKEPLRDCRNAVMTGEHQQRVDKAVSDYLRAIQTRVTP